ncbi:hypothetical protein [Natronomonas amylolytica]|uniref:hypothetical protein n=1 Tax=Natronomonas amylolytica TaxID=3108498 RepID=UPI003008B88F
MPAAAPERVVDVRPLDDPPFEAILASLGDFADAPVVVHSAEPTTLYETVDERGLSARTTRRGGDWHVRITARDCGRTADRDDRRSRPDGRTVTRRTRIESIADLANPELL